MNPRRLRVFLDANILHRAAIRDFILRVPEAGVIDVRWSDRVLDETRRSLESRGYEPSGRRTQAIHRPLLSFQRTVGFDAIQDPQT